MLHPHIRYSDVEKIHKLALTISPEKLVTKCTTIRAYFAQNIIKKAITIGNSFYKIIPDLENESIHEYDVGTLSTLSRVLIELTHIYNYLCKDKISEEEFEHRSLLFDLHHYEESIQILKSFGFSERYLVDPNFYKKAHSRLIVSNNFHDKLCEKQKRKILNASQALFRNGQDFNYYNLDKEVESGLYKLFSQYIHSLGSSVFQNSNEDNPIGFKGVMFLAIESFIIYYSYLLHNYISLRWKIGKMLTAENRKYIKQNVNYNQIKLWVAYYEGLEGKGGRI